MSKCFLCKKETKEEDLIYKKSKVFKGGICPNCYLDSYKYHTIDRETGPQIFGSE